MNPTSRLLLALVAGTLGAGCASTRTAETPSHTPATATAAAVPSAGAPATAAPVAATAPASTPAVAATARTARPAHQVEDSPLAKRSVYFDFDRFVLRSEFDDLVRRHAGHLGANKTFKVQVQGHADERGSREYNLALGQKRADAVRQRLTQLGVPSSRIETVSYGEERPKAAGRDEAAWSENRRGDILYDGEY